MVDEAEWYESLKERINQMLWMILPGETTLSDAEAVAVEAHQAIVDTAERLGIGGPTTSTQAAQSPAPHSSDRERTRCAHE